MQITDEAHQLVSEALSRTLLNHQTRPGDLEDLTELCTRLSGLEEEFDPADLDTYPVAGPFVAGIMRQYLTGTLTADVSAEAQGLTVDELAGYGERSSVTLNELPLLCQVAAAYGLRMDIVFTPEV